MKPAPLEDLQRQGIGRGGNPACNRWRTRLLGDAADDLEPFRSTVPGTLPITVLSNVAT